MSKAAETSQPAIAQTGAGGTGLASVGAVGEVKKIILHDTNKESAKAKCARVITCHCCCYQKSTITREEIVVKEWKGCERTENSMDIDKVKDLQLNELCTPCLCICGRGDIRVYGKDSTTKAEYFTLYNVEHAAEVFLSVSGIINKIDSMKDGLARPTDHSIPDPIYNSRKDPFLIKCCRTTWCGCWNPTTIVTKGAVNQSRWQKCGRTTTRMDFDDIKDIQVKQGLCDYCFQTGTIRVFGTDSDQKADFFDITSVGHVKKVGDYMRRQVDLLNNRQRVNLVSGNN